MIFTSEEQIQTFREGGRVLAEIIQKVSQAAVPGIMTKDLDKLTRELISHYGVKPSFLGYNNFPAVICLSVNDEAVHAPPSLRRLNGGDLLKIDMGIVHGGFHTDSAITILVGGEKAAKALGAAEKLHLMAVTRDALMAGIAEAQPGNQIRDIGAAVQRVADKNKVKVLKELGGHGIGEKLHEEPFVPNFNDRQYREKIVPGMALAIEPIFALSTEDVVDGDDGLTYKTVDGSLAAHFEHTILVTDSGPVVITE